MNIARHSLAAGLTAALLATTAAQGGTLLAGYRIIPVPGFDGSAGVEAFDGATLAGKAGGFVTETRPVGLAYGAGGIFVSRNPPDGGIAGVTERHNTSGGITSSRSDDYTFPNALAYGDNHLYSADAELVGLGSVHYVRTLNNDLSLTGAAFEVPEHVNGLAYGNNSLYIAYGHVIERRDLSGAILDSTDFGDIFSFGPLAFGGGRLYVGYSIFTGLDIGHGIDALDGLTLDEVGAGFALDHRAEGLAYGEGALYTSYDFSVARYGLDGVQTATNDVLGFAGPLAYIPSPGRPADCPPGTRVCDTPRGGVPEPGVWSVLILGFGLAGQRLRRRMAVAV